MRVIVTGATGFVGRAVLRALIRNGHEVVAVVRDRNAKLDNVETVVWDFDEIDRPMGLPRQIDAIVHGAQARNYRTFPQDGGEMFRVNTVGAWRMLDYAVQAGVQRFCLLSSGTVYEPYRRLDVEAPLAPASFLGATKLASEVLARPYGSLFALSVFRLFFPYGPGQRERLVPDIIRRVRCGAPIQVTADGEGLRFPPTYVEDIADIVAMAITEGWTETLNLASPDIVSLRRLAEMIGKMVGQQPIFEITDRAPLVISPPIVGLQNHVGPKAFTCLEQGLRQVLAEQPADANVSIIAS
jgi:nucleoside-diphosphate-sugar epimerase